MTGSDADGLWVRSEVLPTGVYGVVIGSGPDWAMRLDRDRAIAYAAACVGRALEAEHDCAVYGLLVDRLQLDDADAGAFVLGDLLPRRPRPAESPTAPLQFIHMIGRRRTAKRERVAVIELRLEGRTIGTLSPTALREHAEAVLSALAAVGLDEQLYRMLREVYTLDEATARSVVHELPCHWPAP